ncbi:MAG: nitroreductase family protein [Rikenellaceae bacterium]
MKNVSHILNLLLAAALVVLSVKLTLSQSENTSPTTNPEDKSSTTQTMNTIDAIMTRSSVRTYTDQAIEEQQIETMLKAAMAAPTAGNRQPWQFIVVDDKAILEQFPPVIKGANMAPKAPLAIVVCGEPDKSFEGELSEYWVQDASAATENLLLAAHSLGLGAVWCGVYPDQNGRVAKIQEILSLPEGVKPLNIIVIGYPSGKANIKDKWAPEKVSYNQFGKKK